MPSLVVCGIIAACSASPTGPGGDDVWLEPSSVTLSSGQSTRLRAKGPDGTSPLSWMSHDPSVAVVDEEGVVRAVGPGTVRIEAEIERGGPNGPVTKRQATVRVQEAGATQQAFPGAEGWGAGALSSCSRLGMQVLEVTNLDDSGPGSLRAAVEAARNDRLSLVVFRRAGYLDLHSDIELRDKSCLYLAGQTAPGDGITIRRSPGRVFMVKGDSHDIVIRHLRFRGGWGGDKRGHIGIHIGSGHDIILDHLSLGWTTDKAIVITKTVTSWSRPIRRVTVQRSILSEILGDHPTGAQISGEDSDGATEWKNIQDITLHRNLFAHNSHRNPNVTTLGTELINNVVYNWRQGAVQSTRGSRLDVIANYFKPGPMTDSRYTWEVTWNCENHEGFEPSIYVAENVGPSNSDPDADNWSGSSRMVACYYDTGGSPGAELPSKYRRDRSLKQPQFPVARVPARAALDDVLGNAGASARLSCSGGWEARSDAVDRRVLREVREGTGPSQPPMSESEAGGFPSLDAGMACVDSDGDGMPDEFEERFGFEPDDPGDGALDRDGDGYSNVEEYVNASTP